MVSITLAVRVSVFSFQDDNLSKYRQIFTKLGICIICGDPVLDC